MSCKSDIIPRCENDDRTKYDNTPIHRARLYGCRKREETEHENRCQKHQCDYIDSHAVTAERPAPVGQRLAANTFQEDAADGDHVGGDEGGDCKRYDGLKGDGGADVDEREEDGDD